jgi:hypothetical protein
MIAGEAIMTRRAIPEMNCFIECNLSLNQRFAVEGPSSGTRFRFITNVRATKDVAGRLGPRSLPGNAVFYMKTNLLTRGIGWASPLLLHPERK